ncbi:MAG: phosphatase PAP2 family protein [Oscillospiraceae bacterium]|nr:phosphatase PAP2 family protein [Oscillospiraceae bacterium]
MPEVIQTIDETVLRWIGEHLRLSWLNGPVKLYTTLGNAGLLFIVLTLVLLMIRKTRKTGLAAAGGLIVDLLVVNITVKPLVSRLRPWVVMEGFETLLTSSDPNSFPSGHTCAAFAFAAAVCVTAPKKWMKAAALIVAALMGWSRLYVGVHFPSDVLAGVVIGTLCGLAGAWLVKKITEFVQRRQAAK